MLTNCSACTQIIEVSSYNFHKLEQCEKKADFKQCSRCNEAVEVDFFEQHTQELKCLRSNKEFLRCALCHKDIDKFEGASEDLAWRKHLGYKECSAANVRVSTNAKARISILKTKRPPASEVILEVEDEEEEN